MPITKATRHVRELEAENARLRALIQRLLEIGPGMADYIWDDTGQFTALWQLLKDCQEAMAAIEAMASEGE